MSDPHTGSRAPYIIICNGRIAAKVAKKPEEKIAAASDAAARLTSYYGGKNTHIPSANSYAISTLQHEMMDNLDTWNSSQIQSKVDEMFTLLDQLEDVAGGY